MGGFEIPPPTPLSKLLRSSVLVRLEGFTIVDTGEDGVLVEGRGIGCRDGDF